MALIGGYDNNTGSNQLKLDSATVSKRDTKTILDVQNFDMPNLNRAIDMRGDGQPTYQGWALPGMSSGTGSTFWAITKHFYNTNSLMTSQLWASGNSNMDKDWNDRTTYPYS